MPRKGTFPKSVKKLAFERARGLCEAGGEVYGWEKGKKCNAPLSKGVEYDHWPIRAEAGGSNTLENCAAVCIACHEYKTRNFDIPQAAKTKRMSNKANGIDRPKSKLSRKAPKEKKGDPFGNLPKRNLYQ